MKIIIAGGTGFLGKVLVHHFNKKADCVVLTRGKSKEENNVQYINWDAKNLGDWTSELEGADVLINLVGKSVDCRYTDKNKSLILKSRLDSTYILGLAMVQAENPPKIWLNSASATIYRHSEDKQMSELNGEYGEGFSVEVCRKWEREFFQFLLPHVRKVAMRTSIVMGKKGGAIHPLNNLAKLYLGGKQGKGKQFFSWIHQEDFARAVEFIINKGNIHGPVNMVAPEPIKNKQLMKEVRKSVNRSFGFPMPTGLLKFGAIIIGTEVELILKSRNVIPGVLLENDFEFNFGQIKDALNEIQKSE